jgi:hypothetical protein
MYIYAVASWGGGVGFGGFKPPLPKFRSFDKAELNYQFREKYLSQPNKNTGFTHLQMEQNP